VLGATVVLLGIAMIVLPGRAFIVIPIGLAILRVEFAWARRWLRELRARAQGVPKRGANGLKQSCSFLGTRYVVQGFGCSKWTAKRLTGAQLIEQLAHAREHWLVETVQRYAQRAGIGMPEVAIFDTPDVNAFATGMRRDHALVAVSTGLLESMTRDDAEAVLSHEVSPIAKTW
jgi:Zn-dependent protease with chaperone function